MVHQLAKRQLHLDRNRPDTKHDIHTTTTTTLATECPWVPHTLPVVACVQESGGNRRTGNGK
jgi:hypothetical protein